MGKQSKTRIAEHRNYIRRNTSVLSVISEHKLEFGHEFDSEQSKDSRRGTLSEEKINLKDALYQEINKQH